jgi:GTP cyclohydrolase II
MNNPNPHSKLDCTPQDIQGPIHLPLRIDKQEIPYQLWYYSFGTERWVAAFTGDITNGEPVPLRIESACLFGHIFHSAKCDCGYQLDEAFRRIAQLGKGIVIYGIDQDARGLGIAAHFQIYVLRQQENLDTDAVYERLQAPVDARSYEPVVFILRHLKIHNILLLSNNPQRKRFLLEQGFEVLTESLEAPLDVYNMSTLMLEKEDLGYTWSFKTHGDWLAPLQARVDGDTNKQAAQLVLSTETLIAEYVDTQWNTAYGLAKIVNVTKEQQGDLVVYVTDFPRVDELATYAAMGACFVVVPFPEIPGWLRSAGIAAGIRIQDWGRKNRYEKPRPQWDLVYQSSQLHVYRRCNQLRCVFPEEVESTNSPLQKIEAIHKCAALVMPENAPYIAQIQPNPSSWIEINQSNEPNAEQLRAAGFEVIELPGTAPDKILYLLVDLDVSLFKNRSTGDLDLVQSMLDNLSEGGIPCRESGRGD